MLNLLMNDHDDFAQQLRRLNRDVPLGTFSSHSSPAHEWHTLHCLQYWNDADSVAGNLRKLEHWLQRARQQN